MWMWTIGISACDFLKLKVHMPVATTIAFAALILAVLAIAYTIHSGVN